MEHTVETALTMNVIAEKAWGVLDYFGGVEKFSVGVESSPIIGNQATGLGAKRHCVFYDKSSVIEEIIDYQDKTSLKVVLSEFTMPMKTMYAGFRVEKRSDTQCEVFMHMNFVMKFGPLGALMGLMMRPMMKSVQKKMLSGLAYHALTGNAIGDKLPPQEELAQALA